MTREVPSIDGFPYRRGITSIPYREAPWIVGQYSGFSDPKSTNRRFRDLIAEGQQGLAIALDLPTQFGLDPDSEMARGEVGRVGVGLASLNDLEELFEGIQLDEVRQISTTANSIGPIMVGLFLAFSERRGIDPNSFSLRLQNDVLKEYVARGTQFLPVPPATKLSVDAIEYCVKHLPGWVPISISGYHIRDAGATRERELGFTLSNAREYLRRVEERGVPAAEVAQRVTWFLSASEELIHETAKFRAARELWSRMLFEEFAVREPSSLKLRIIAYTLGSQLSPHEVRNNSVRVTLSALGAVLGGVQVLFCSSIDEAHGLPTDENALLSMRTQQILLEESGVADFVDVFGGSEVVEGLTTEILEGARRIDMEVSERGGPVAGISSGWMRDTIDLDAYAQHRAEGVGVGRIGPDSGADTVAEELSVFELPAGTEQGRIERFQRQKRLRNEGQVDRVLEQLRRAVDSDVNLVEGFKECFLRGATLGEICSVLRAKYGAWGSSKEFTSKPI